MVRIGGVPLHRDDVKVGAVNVERVNDVPGEALVDEEHFDDVADVDFDDVRALAELGSGTIPVLQGELVASLQV